MNVNWFARADGTRGGSSEDRGRTADPPISRKTQLRSEHGPPLP
jgi:hypothetical protein